MTRSLPVLFQCLPLGPRLTRRACGMRHLEAKVASKGNKLVVRDETCRTCSVGDKHASGLEPAHWPDGTPITTAEPSVAQPPGTPEAKPIRLDAPVRARAVPVTPKKETSMPPPRPITFQGRTQSISDWAREIGITPQAISSRIKLGMANGLDEAKAVASALTRPRDPKQPATRSLDPSTPAARKKRGLAPLKVDAPAVSVLREQIVPSTVKKARAPKATGVIENMSRIVAFEELPPPVEAKIDGAGVHTAEAALLALGYRVTSIRVPAGLALIVSTPS